MPLRFEPGTRSTHLTPLTIRHLLDANIVSACEDEIVYRDSSRYTYMELRQRVGRLASALDRIDVEQGTTVAVLDWDSHRYLECYFAVPMMGAVLQSVNVRLSPSQILYTLQHARAEVLLVHTDFLDLVEGMRSELPNVGAIVALEITPNEQMPAWVCGEYEALLAKAEPDFPFEDFDENAVATTFYTTGTTGLPKAVCYTHRQLVLHTLAFNAPFGVTYSRGFGIDDVYMPLTPMFHVHAWGLPYIATMLGVKQVYAGRFDPDTVLDLQARERVTFSHCVPTVLQMILTAAEERDISLDGWLMVIGGSALTRELRDRSHARGIEVLAGFGMSETGPLISLARPSRARDGKTDPDATIRSGVPLPLVSARIVDEAMADCPADDCTHGELVVRAPWLTPCYLGDDAASERLWAGGWLHTQDIATMAPDGSIQIRDRLKDVIKSGGEWICSLTVEGLILASPDVSEVAVVAIPDPKWQERPAAMIVPAPGRNPTLDQINAILNDAVLAGEISRWGLLDRIELTDALPRTSVGKVDKKTIRALLAA